ncbi:MAG: hypothetical protein OHK93_005977 [Ramalina farinacea]|uniref:Ankyrin n=1 Tax=Ramalina farinacea TaxID=258253 RepID=A0AA43QKQ2_9LECA|nr:hypothetical protein [Ramalina farinacea]
MADEDDGATPSELLLEACRRNNPSLLHHVLAQPQFQHQPPKNPSSPPSPLSTLLNNTLDPLGRTPLHICAASGADEVLDLLLDQEGLEVEPTERHGGDTPLHCAVRYVVTSYENYLRDRARDRDGGSEEEEVMKSLMQGVELLLDAGADPRIRNEGGRGVKPVGLLVGRGERGVGEGEGGFGESGG